MQQQRSTHTNEQPSLSKKQREQQREMVMRLFKHWQLTNPESAILLGLSPKTGTSINKYKTGNSSLPQNRDTQDRVNHILAIHRYLRQAYPYNDELAYRWIKTPNADFQHHSPFEVIANEGFSGLLRIRNYLTSNQEY